MKTKCTVLSLLPYIRISGKYYISRLANMSRKVNSSWISVKTHWLFTDWLVIFFVIIDCRRLPWIMDGYCVCFIRVYCMKAFVVTNLHQCNRIKALLCETAMIAVTYGLLHCVTLTLISLYLWCNISIHVWLANTLIFRLTNVLISVIK